VLCVNKCIDLWLNVPEQQNTHSFIDRQIIVQESIKNELLLSDTQLGLLSGLSFAAIYIILGIPIARLADFK